MKKKLVLLLLMAGFFILHSCKDAYDFSTDNLSSSIEQTSEWALPIADASITLEELLPNDEDSEQFLLIDEDNFITLIYEQEVTQVDPGEFFDGFPIGGEYTGTIDQKIEYSVASQVVELGIDQLLNEGSIYLADPRVTVSLRNYWDIGARFMLTDFYYYEGATSDPIAVTGPLTEWIDVVRSVDGAEAVTEMSMNKDNSNIADLISALPHHLSFGAQFETTVLGEDYSVPENSVNSVDLKIEIPMELRFEDLVLTDTIDFDLGNELDGDTSAIESFSFKINLNNGFPFELASQIYFADENYVILDSLSATGLNFTAGNSTNGENDPVLTETEISVEGSKIHNLIKSKYLFPRFEFNSRNVALGETVKLYSTYAIGLKLGARAKLKLKVN